MALLTNPLVNPGLTSDQIITLLRKHYGNRDYRNMSTDKKIDIRFKTAMKHLRITQHRGDSKLSITSYGRYFTWIPSFILGLSNRNTIAASNLRSKLAKDLEEAARTGNANVS